MRTLRFVFLIVFLVVIPTSEIGVGQTPRHRHRPGPSVANTSEQGRSSPAVEENEKIEEQCSLPDRPKPEVEVKANAMLCGKAISLPKPPYPEDAKAAKASGPVTVQVLLHKKGQSIGAK